MIKLLFNLLWKLAILIGVGLLLQKLGFFKFLKTGISFLNEETRKHHQNKEKILKFKMQLKKSLRRCDEL